jgi:hypothetical protein
MFEQTTVNGRYNFLTDPKKYKIASK